jgi:hypothetical protein
MTTSGVLSDQKVKLLAPGFGGFTGVLSPLSSAGGVVFPYTPTIQISHSANYGSYDMTHSVYQQNYFINTNNPSISLTGTFTAQTKSEAQYSAAALHFFKSATKPDFGATSNNPGVPPGVLMLSAYGALHARNVPVIVKSFSYALPEDSDYLTFDLPVIGRSSIPSIFIVSIELTTQYTPTKVRNGFSLRNYKSGLGLNRGFM